MNLSSLYRYDEDKFRKSYLSDLNTANQAQLLSRLIFSSHSLEKSLSNDNFKVGFGLDTAEMLTNILVIYKDRLYDTSDYGYINTLSVLKSFYEKHKDSKYKVQVETILSPVICDVIDCKETIGGSSTIRSVSKDNNKEKNFKELAEGRFAVRTYSKKSVKKSDIDEAISIAIKTPSACNRQSARVHAMYDDRIIRKVLSFQGGIAFYKTPPVLLLVTANDNCYLNVNERNQGFIDGGLFTMSLLYSLEYKQLAACPLHAMFDERTEKTIRATLNIPDNEKLVSFISVGHFNKKNNVCKSFRYSVEHYRVEVSKIVDIKPEHIVINSVGKKTVIARAREKLKIRTRLRDIKHGLRLRTRIKNVLGRIKRSKTYDGAIVSLTGNFNYGNIIQRYALQHYLDTKGLKYKSFVFGPMDVAEGKYEDTTRFITRYLDIDKYDPATAGSYKSYIVGSDQTWYDWWDNWQEYGKMWLSFVNSKRAGRIAYAASFGHDSLKKSGIDSKKMELIIPCLQKFKAVSTREESGRRLLRELGRDDSTSNLDPTMLLTAKDYSELIDRAEVSNDVAPIFTYLLDQDVDKSSYINKLSKKRKQAVSGISLRDNKFAPVEAWLKGFRDADLVITDSFHGIVFSIINNTDFIVFGNKKRGLARMKDILHLFGLEDRLIIASDSGEYIYKSLPSVDWKRVNRKLKEERRRSGEWLINSLKG